MNRTIKAVALSTIFLTTCAVQAAETYLGGSVGVVLTRDNDFEGTDVTSKSGVSASGYIGTMLSEPCSLEAELLYQSADLDVEEDATLSNVSLFANGVYRGNMASAAHPFVKGGLGFAKVTAEDDADDYDDTVLAFQFLAGLEFPFSAGNLTAAYRFNNPMDPEFESGGMTAEVDYATHTLEVGYRF